MKRLNTPRKKFLLIIIITIFSVIVCAYLAFSSISFKKVGNMDKFDFFWNTMELCDWTQQGDDEKVLAPVVEFLSELEDEEIFKFEDLMSELLYDLDTKTLAEQFEISQGYLSPDAFLYSRCVAIINGREFYEEVKMGHYDTIWNLEFESILYVPMEAWALKNNLPLEEYTYISPISYETGSNVAKWE